MQKTLTAFIGIVLLALASLPASAQTRRERGWLDVNIGMAVAAEDGLSTTYNSAPDSGGERQTYGVTYSFPTGASFDVGGGVMFTDIVGLGLTLTGTAHEDVASLSARIPHPVLLNRYGSATSETDEKLMRAEGGVNISAVFKLPTASDKVRVRAFAGPTYFRLTADAITDIRYVQTYNTLTGLNNISITSYDTKEVEATAWGFHAGADVSWMFSRVVGIGGFARFSRGSVTIDDTDVPADDAVDVTTGGFQYGVGVRLRF